MTRLVVDTVALKKNISTVIKQAGGTPIYAVVKGNGYGLGLTAFARLLRKEGITRFAVTEAEDARALRSAGLEHEEILMLRPTTDSAQLKSLISDSVVLTVASSEDAVAAAGVAEELSTVAAIHIKIDTGMGRYGFMPDELDRIASIYKFMQRLAVCGVYTHFHSAFSSSHQTEQQYEAFMSVLDKLHAQGYETGIAHVCNSSALFRHSDMKLDAVRVGSAFLGRLSFKNSLPLVKIGYAESAIEQIRWLPKGSSVGYGAVWIAKKPTQVAILPIGWYHGFSLEKSRDVWRLRDCLMGCLSLIKAVLTRKALYVNVGGQRAKVLGHVGMLNTVIDVTNITCAVGDTVKLDINPTLAKGLEVQYR